MLFHVIVKRENPYDVRLLQIRQHNPFLEAKADQESDLIDIDVFNLVNHIEILVIRIEQAGHAEVFSNYASKV